MLVLQAFRIMTEQNGMRIIHETWPSARSLVQLAHVLRGSRGRHTVMVPLVECLRDSFASSSDHTSPIAPRLASYKAETKIPHFLARSQLLHA